MLLEHTDAHVLVTGRNEARATSVVAWAEREHLGRSTTAHRVDAADPRALRSALDGVDLLAAASSTSTVAATALAACADASADYLDIQLSSSKAGRAAAPPPPGRDSGHLRGDRRQFPPGGPGSPGPGTPPSGSQMSTGRSSAASSKSTGDR
jgi:hypothetical protein